LVKCIMKMDLLVAVYMHSPDFCMHNKQCVNVLASWDDTLNFHYRDGNDTYYGSITETVVDKTMMKYRDELIKAVEVVWDETGFRP
jgi:hypothetical protein